LDTIREKEIRKYVRDATLERIATKTAYEPLDELSLEWIFVKPSFEDVYTPKRIEALHGHTVHSVSSGGAHSALITKEGKAFTFGDNTYGQCGHGVYLPTYPIPTELSSSTCEYLVSGVKQIVCGNKHTVCTCEGENGSHMLYFFGKQGRDAAQENTIRSLFLSHIIDGTEKEYIHTASKSYFSPTLIPSSLEESESIVKIVASESLTIFATGAGRVYAVVPGTITKRRRNSSISCNDYDGQCSEPGVVNKPKLRTGSSSMLHDNSTDMSMIKLCDDNEFITDVGVGGGGLVMTNETVDHRKFDNTIYNEHNDNCAFQYQFQGEMPYDNGIKYVEHAEVVNVHEHYDVMHLPPRDTNTNKGIKSNNIDTNMSVGSNSVSNSRTFTRENGFYYTSSSTVDGIGVVEQERDSGGVDGGMVMSTGHIVLISSSYLDNSSILSSLADHSPKSSMSSFSSCSGLSYSNYSFVKASKLAKATSGKRNRDFCVAFPQWKNRENKNEDDSNCVIF